MRVLILLLSLSAFSSVDFLSHAAYASYQIYDYKTHPKSMDEEISSGDSSDTEIRYKVTLPREEAALLLSGIFRELEISRPSGLPTDIISVTIPYFLPYLYSLNHPATSWYYFKDLPKILQRAASVRGGWTNVSLNPDCGLNLNTLTLDKIAEIMRGFKGRFPDSKSVNVETESQNIKVLSYYSWKEKICILKLQIINKVTKKKRNRIVLWAGKSDASWYRQFHLRQDFPFPIIPRNELIREAEASYQAAKFFSNKFRFPGKQLENFRLHRVSSQHLGRRFKPKDGQSLQKPKEKKMFYEFVAIGNTDNEIIYISPVEYNPDFIPVYRRQIEGL